MDTNRLDALYKAIHHFQKQGLCEGDEYELLDSAYEEVCQQQAEIERLHRAYERATRELSWLTGVSVYEPYKLTITVALAEAQRIKEGKDEPQICVDCQMRNAVKDQLCNECYREWENEGTLE